MRLAWKKSPAAISSRILDTAFPYESASKNPPPRSPSPTPPGNGPEAVPGVGSLRYVSASRRAIGHPRELVEASVGGPGGRARGRPVEKSRPLRVVVRDHDRQATPRRAGRDRRTAASPAFEARPVVAQQPTAPPVKGIASAASLRFRARHDRAQRLERIAAPRAGLDARRRLALPPARPDLDAIAEHTRDCVRLRARERPSSAASIRERAVEQPEARRLVQSRYASVPAERRREFADSDLQRRGAIEHRRKLRGVQCRRVLKKARISSTAARVGSPCAVDQVQRDDAVRVLHRRVRVGGASRAARAPTKRSPSACLVGGEALGAAEARRPRSGRRARSGPRAPCAPSPRASSSGAMCMPPRCTIGSDGCDSTGASIAGSSIIDSAKLPVKHMPIAPTPLPAAERMRVRRERAQPVGHRARRVGGEGAELAADAAARPSLRERRSAIDERRARRRRTGAASRP